MSETSRTKPTVAAGIMADSDNEKHLRVVHYQPGNGTRYVVMFSDLYDIDALVQKEIGCEPYKNVVVTLLSERPYHSIVVAYGNRGGDFHPSTFPMLHTSYIRECLKVGEADATALAELIAFYFPVQTNVETPKVVRLVTE